MNTRFEETAAVVEEDPLLKWKYIITMYKYSITGNGPAFKSTEKYLFRRKNVPFDWCIVTCDIIRLLILIQHFTVVAGRGGATFNYLYTVTVGGLVQWFRA